MSKVVRLSMLALFCAILSFAKAQSPFQDSIQQVIATSNDPMVKSQAWFEVARKYHKSNKDSALWATQRALLVLKDEPISEHKTNLIRYYGFIKCAKQELDSSWMYLEQAEQHAKEQKYLALMGVILMDKATYMNYKGEMQKGILYLKKAKEYLSKYNTEKVFVCINEMGAFYYYLGKQDSAFLLFKEAAVVAKKEGEALNLSMVQMNLAIMYDINGQPDSALTYYKLAIKSGELSGNDFRTGEAHMNLGTFYEERNHIKGSIEQFQKAISYLEKTGDQRALFMAFENIALAYLSIENQKTAYKYLLLSEDLLKQNNFREGNSVHYKGMATYYSSVKQIDSCLNYLLLSGDAFMQLKRKCEASQQYVRYISLASKEQKPYQEVMEKLNGLDKECSGQVKYDNLQHMARVYLNEGKLDMAEAATDTALVFLRKSNYTKNTMTALQTKSQIYEARGDYKNAYETLAEIVLLKDSVLNIDREQEVNYLELQFQESKTELLEKQAKADELLIGSQQHLIGQKNRLNIALVMVALLILALLGVLLYTRRKDRLLYEEISLRNRQVSEQNETIMANIEQLKENNRQKDNLMGIVAHDLGSPLRSIKGLCQMMLDLEEVEGDTKRNVELMNKSVENGINLTQELMEANQFLDTKDRPKTEFKISELANNIIELNRQAAQRKRIALHQKIEQDLVLNTSKESLNRTLDNLISNAIKFSESNKNVWFTARKADDGIEISVKDEGQGFSEKDMENVFQPFQKLSSRPTNDEGSTGLGLSIVKKLVEEINGDIQLKSEKGKGAEFTITLPLETVSAP